MKKKRFIAGAQCPSCKALDKIFTYEVDDAVFRACSRCDFNELMTFANASTEMPTRVNRSRQEREEEVKPVRIMDPKQLH